MEDSYTRKEVADLLDVSKATVYHYAKQRKIIKVDDPHRLLGHVRYKRAEVDALAEERKRNEPTGLRPSELAQLLGVTTQRIYTLLKQTDLRVDQLPAGDERTIYSIPDETAEWIEQEVKRTIAVRGTRSEFYDPTNDIALYQLFTTQHGQHVRVLRKDNQAWGFYSQSQTWIPFIDAINIYKYERVYSIHRPNRRITGYTDFILPKDLEESFIFLDFIYQTCGIENVRIREYDQQIALSVKSGVVKFSIDLPEILTEVRVKKLITIGDIVVKEGHWTFISGYRRTTFDLPNELLDELQKKGKDQGLSMSEYVETAIREKFERETKENNTYPT